MPTRTVADVPPVIDAPPPGDVRRAADALRLTAALAVLTATVVLATATRYFAQTSQQGLLQAVTALPPGLRDALVGIVQVVAIAAPLTALWAVRTRQRWDALARILPAAGLGVLIAWLLSDLALAGSRPGQWPDVLAGRGGLVPAGWPSMIYLAGCAAAAVAAGPWLPARGRRAVWALPMWCAILSAATASILPLEAVAAPAIGAVAGSAILLIGGAPDDRPSARAVAAALVDCGIPVTCLTELPAAERIPGEGVLYLAETSGPAFTIRVLAGDDQRRDLFRRWSRWLLLREPGDVAQTPLAATEHELLMLVAADRAGARVVEPAIAYPVAGGGALLATTPVTTTTLRNPSDALLTDVWTSVARLQEHRIAHRALRPDHVLVTPDGRIRLTAFARGRLAATTRQLGSDVAELLAATAIQVGPERAVAAALTGLGPERLASVMPYLQPLALTSATRRAVTDRDRAETRAARASERRRTLHPGGRPSLLRDLATHVRSATNAPEQKPAPLARFTWKQALGLAGGFLVLHLILPQLSNAGAAVAALRTADWWWILAALPTTFVSQLFSTMLQSGTIPERLPFLPNYTVQFAASFLNRITPSNVGGMALNLRFLQKAGVDAGAATASVGLQTLLNGLGSVVVAVVFFAWTGRGGQVHLQLPTTRELAPVLLVLIVAGVGVAMTGPGRRFLREKVWRFLRSAADAIAAIAADPVKLARCVVGGLGLPLVQMAGLALCLHAFGVGLPFVQVGAVYIGARLLANAAPTPGGLGALEAALIAGLTALGAAAGAATSAVLVYRLLSFWLNVPVGWAALGIAQRREFV
ncbi:flippase-like domain-containing protein [Nocardia sp. NPDC004123]